MYAITLTFMYFEFLLSCHMGIIFPDYLVDIMLTDYVFITLDENLDLKSGFDHKLMYAC